MIRTTSKEPRAPAVEVYVQRRLRGPGYSGGVWQHEVDQEEDGGLVSVVFETVHRGMDRPRHLAAGEVQVPNNAVRGSGETHFDSLFISSTWNGMRMYGAAGVYSYTKVGMKVDLRGNRKKVTSEDIAFVICF